MLTIESVRELYNATRQDEAGLYYRVKDGERSYTFTRNGENLCFTCESVVPWNGYHVNCSEMGA